MAIQIDKSLFLPKINKFANSKRRPYRDNSVALSEEVMDEAQNFFNDAPWVGGRRENWDTQKECRLEMKRYILNKIDLEDRDRSYFIPSFVWIWIAKMVINYVIKLIIEHYWSDLQKEMGIDY
jgi:hypothetical protein